MGKRVFFLHDGRTCDLLQAIENHSAPANPPFPASEANTAIQIFNLLPAQAKQDILNFLRSL